jgi:WD40 repeat protein/DNA-binding SARP family transcriptional activator
VRYRVLGPLQIENGHRGTLGGWKEQAVLAQLLANANSALPADRLAFGIWGDAQPATASRTLQAYVTRVRRAVEPVRDARPTVLVTVTDGWMLRVGPDEVDASVFEAQVRKARGALAHGHAARARDQLSQALGLWRGDPYAGFDGLPTCRPEAIRLAELRKLAEDEWLAALLGAGDVEEVVTAAEGLLRAEPLRETRWALLIRAQCLAGRPGDALEAYARARAVLRDELGAHPGPELQRLQRAILSDDAVVSVHTNAGQEIPEALARTGPRLVGRDAEIERLATRWAAVVSGAGGVLVVSGAAGVGKSRLAAELARRASGRRVVVRHASAGPGSNPEAVLTGLLRGVDADRSSTSRESGAPALVVLDDVQWVGGLLWALPRLAKELVDQPVLVLVLARDEPGGGAPVDLPLLRVGPLPPEDIAEIAVSYQAGGLQIDVARVVSAARGLPGPAHALAAAAASQVAARRIRAAARRAERSRRGFAAVHDELTDGVLAAEEIRRKAALFLPADAPAQPSRVPYQGLATFETADAEVFFGRERVVAELVARLATTRFLAVVGASGCGKSSLVRAGVLPALQAGGLPDSGKWTVDVVTPAQGDQPTIAPDGLLVVDQLEELFIAGSPSEVDRYSTAMAEAARAGRVLVTLRSDFYPDAAAHPVLGPLLESGTAVLGPMRLEELRRAIVEPALAVGLDIADDLVDAALQDVAGQPGALALLSVALLETYRRRVGPTLGLDAYRTAGGVAGALARLAERAYAGLRGEQRAGARRVLLRLAEEDRGRLVRRRAPLTEVVPAGGNDAATAAVVEALTRQRLLVVADGTVEVAHEALLAAWPRCRDWLAADAAGRQVRGQLAAAAAAWHSAGRRETDLYRGMRLAAASEWAAEHADELTPLERDFVDGSREAAEEQRLAAEARAAYRATQARRLRYALAAVAAFLVASLVAGLLAVRAARVSRAQADAEAAARLGALALTEQRVDTAALLAVQAVSLHDSPETRADLLSTLLRWPQIRRVAVPTGARLLGMGLSDNGREIAVTDNHGRVARVDTATWLPHGPLVDTRSWRAFGAQFSPDGRLLASTSQTGGTAMGLTLALWDARTGVELQRVPSGSAVAVLWAPPGSPVVAVTGSTDALGSWTGPTGHWREHPGPTSLKWSVPVAFSPGGHRLLVADQNGWATWYDPLTWRPLSRIPISTHQTWAALDPAQRVLAVGDDDGTVRLLDARTGHVQLTLGGQRGVIEDLDFDSTGQRLVSTADDGTAVVWNLAGGDRIWSFSGLGGLIAVSAMFAPSGARPGDRLYLASHDGTLLDVNLAGALLGRPATAAAAQDAAVWPAGRAPVSFGIDGTLHTVDLDTERPPGPPPEGLGTGANLVSIGGTDTVLMNDATNVPGRVALFDLGGHLIREFLPGSPRAEDDVSALAAAPAARLVFAATADREIFAYDGATGSLVWSRRFGTQDDPFLRGARLAYDARRNGLAVSLGDHTVTIVDAATGRDRRVIRVTDEVLPPAVAFDPRTGTLLTGDNDGTLGFWDPVTGHRLVPPVPGPPAYPRVLQVSDTGDRAATIGHDGSVAVWDTAARRLLARLPTHGAKAGAIALAPDGRRLLVIEPDGTSTVWDLDEGSWQRAACNLARRALTQDEWQRFLPGRPYRPACQHAQSR